MKLMNTIESLNYILAPTIQGELFVIDETNTIYYLPCGDICKPVDDAPTPMTTENNFTTTYEYVGCYGDQKDRVLSGRFLSGYDGMTNEVCRSTKGINCCILFILEY